MITTGRASTASTSLPTTLSIDAPEVALDEADAGADHGAEQRRQRRDDQDVAGTHDHTRQHVAAE